MALLSLYSATAGAADYENLLFIISDDVGVDKIGSYAVDVDNPTENRPGTPTIDALASAGVRFTDAWAAPVCSPTRGMIFSGEYAYRNGVGTVIRDPSSIVLGTTQDQIQRLAADSGIATALFGKWHLGETTTTPDAPTSAALDQAEYPIVTGFDVYAGNTDGVVTSYLSWLYTRSYPDATKSSGYSTTAATVTTSVTDKTTDDALAWMDEQSAGGKPRFTVVSYNLAHSTNGAGGQTWTSAVAACGEAAGANRTADVRTSMECLDAEIAELLEGTPDLDQTLVVFIGDNGTPYAVAEGLFADHRGKGTVYESGVRVPFIVADGAAVQDALANGGTLPTGGTYTIDAGSAVNAPTSVVDLYATFADFLDLSSGTCTVGDTCARDSLSLRSVLTGGEPARADVWTEEIPAAVGSTQPGRGAVRSGDFKLLVRVDTGTAPCRAYEMYDLAADRWEATDLYGDPDYAAEKAALRALVEEHADVMAVSALGWLDQDDCVVCYPEETWYDGVDEDCDGASDFDRDLDDVDWPEDCNDLDAAVYPGAVETWYDGSDTDCGGGDDFDQDGDGVDWPEDCDDLDATVHPGAVDAWYDGADADCGGGDDFDQDGDGVDWPADCDDLDAAVYPGAVDPPDDGWDQDCDGLDGGPSVDADADGVTSPLDCDDLDAAVHPGAVETWYDGADTDCAGDGDFDQDGDGVDWPEDCNDLDAAVYPGAVDPPDDGWDQDCDGLDGGPSVDEDGDGVTSPLDCDDLDAAVHPGAVETWYDGSDADCGGDSDFDQDGDGVDWPADCADLDAAVYPGAVETWYDGSDADCGGDSDFDQDADGVDWPADCADLDAAVYPGAAEIWYDGSDTDCGGDSDFDQDGDGVDWPADCADLDAAVYPGAVETCNTADDDCDSLVDEAGSVGEVVWYTDADSDGYGDPSTGLPGCTAPAGRTADQSDCDDQAAETYPGAPERCDGQQNDCAISAWTGAEEDGEVWLESSSGAWSSYTSVWAAGVPGAPASVVLPASGTLWVCDGDYYVDLTASSSGSLAVEALYDSAVLSGGGVGSVVAVSGSGTTLSLGGLTLTGGAGSGSPAAGGALKVTAGTVTVTGCVLEGNHATNGGGVYVSGGTVTVTNSGLADNIATSGGGWYQAGGTVTLTSDQLEGNSATDGGGGYYASGTFSNSGLSLTDNVASSTGGGLRANTSTTLTSASLVGNDAASGGGVYYGGSSGTLALATTLVNANTATGYGGGVYQAAGTLTCTGTTSGTYGFIANVATSGGGGVYLPVKSNVFTTTTCDFGTSSTTNNSSQDILYRTTSYNKGNNVTLSCRSGSCR